MRKHDRYRSPRGRIYNRKDRLDKDGLDTYNDKDLGSNTSPSEYILLSLLFPRTRIYTLRLGTVVSGCSVTPRYHNHSCRIHAPLPQPHHMYSQQVRMPRIGEREEPSPSQSWFLWVYSYDRSEDRIRCIAEPVQIKILIKILEINFMIPPSLLLYPGELVD